MSRLKLVLLGLIITVLIILFVQNRDPLALKLLCPDTSQTCLYQTPALPLAIWMGIFTLGGLTSSLLGQAFNRYRYSGSKVKASREEFPREKNQWSSGRATTPRGKREDLEIERPDSSNYELPQKPERVETTGTTYSYKYRDAKEKPNGSNGKTTRDNSVSDSDINLDKDDEDWI